MIQVPIQSAGRGSKAFLPTQLVLYLYVFDNQTASQYKWQVTRPDGQTSDTVDNKKRGEIDNEMIGQKSIPRFAA